MQTPTRRSVLSCFLVALAVCAGVTPPGARAQQLNQPTNFDFYLFTLSWSPQFCASHRGNPECKEPGIGFIVHGLWPEWNNGAWPQNCSQQPGPTDSASIRDVMQASLIPHEWSKHGTCSGLSADDYFSLIRKVRDEIHIPPDLTTPRTQLSMSTQGIKKDIAQQTTGLDISDIVLGCANSFLVEVQVCVDKNGSPISCPQIRDCSSSNLTIRPVRR
jgi:ribonuclease T2